MATNRQTVVQPLGLVLTPNTYGQYPDGALSFAQNVVMRAPGELWQAPAFGTTQAAAAALNTLRKLYPVDVGNVFTWSRTSGLVWTLNQSFGGSAIAATLPSIAVTTGLFFDTGQIWPVRARERVLVNTATCGVLVTDSMAPSFGTATFRSAGMPQPHVNFFSVGGSNSVIPAGVTIGYAAITKRTFSDGYAVVSVPSPVLVVSVGVSAVDIGLNIRFSTTAGLVAGDILELYRTDGVLNAGSVLVDPGDTLKLVNTHVLTSGEISAGLFQVTDTQVMTAPFYQTPGRELYTNPGQETALQANRQPNINTTQAVFKNYTFFGNITERPAWTFALPTGMADSAAPSLPAAWRANGIGTRRGAGTVTISSNTITGISAADIVGLKIGQVWANSTGIFAAGTTITAVGGTSVTLSTNALTGAATFAFSDQILLDGVQVPFGSYARLLDAVTNDYEITSDTAINIASSVLVTGATVTLEPIRPNKATVTVAATNGANYQEPVPEFNATAKTISRKNTPNLLQWSKDSEPEHVPPSNEINVGTGTIIAMAATKNALWIFCTDGLYRLSGDAPPWRVDLMDPSCIIVAPQALTQMRDVIYAYTNYGIVGVSDSGIEELTTNVLASVFPGPQFTANPAITMASNEFDSEVLVSLNDGNVYVFNTVQKAWTTLVDATRTANVTAMAFQRSVASGQAGSLIGVSPASGTITFAGWGQGTNFLACNVQFQALFGGDPLSMKQFVDETLIFTPSSGFVNVTVTELGNNIASGALVSHNADNYLTVGIPRAYSIAQTSSPGYTRPLSSIQTRFRGISQRFVVCTDQAWRQ